MISIKKLYTHTNYSLDGELDINFTEDMIEEVLSWIRDSYIIRPPYDGIIYSNETKNNELLEYEINVLRRNLSK